MASRSETTKTVVGVVVSDLFGVPYIVVLTRNAYTTFLMARMEKQFRYHMKMSIESSRRSGVNVYTIDLFLR